MRLLFVTVLSLPGKCGADIKDELTFIGRVYRGFGEAFKNMEIDERYEMLCRTFRGKMLSK